MALGGTPFDRSAYRRRIELLDSDLDLIRVLCDHDLTEDSSYSNCVEPGAKFELLRQGGCGPGQFTINDRFPGNLIEDITIGQYIRCRWSDDEEIDPVYLGRIEEITVDSPSGVTLRTQGPMALLNEIQVGGFDSDDLALPHLFAASESQFIYDPDFNLQSWEFVNTVPGLIQTLYDRYIAVKTNIALGDISATAPVPFGSSVFRGQENISQIIRAMAMQQVGASYGVDANNEFFFIDRATTEIHTFKEAEHLTKLSMNTDKDLLFNRLIITGDYVYFPSLPQKFFRWVSAHASLSSINAYGSRKVVLYIPWIRTRPDADAFADAFFDIYADPNTRFSVTTIPQGAVMNPWEGTVGLLNRSGGDLIRTERFDRVEVSFDAAPYLTFTTGPEDLQWPVAPEPQRWELQGGGDGDDGLSDLLSSSSSFADDSSCSVGRRDCVGGCPVGCVQVVYDVRCSDGELHLDYVCVKCCADNGGVFDSECLV